MSSLLLWFHLWIMPTVRFGVLKNAYLHFHRHTSAYLQSRAVITSQHASVDTGLRVFPVVWLWDSYRQVSQQGRGRMERNVSFFCCWFFFYHKMGLSWPGYPQDSSCLHRARLSSWRPRVCACVRTPPHRPGSPAGIYCWAQRPTAGRLVRSVLTTSAPQ